MAEIVKDYFTDKSICQKVLCMTAIILIEMNFQHFSIYLILGYLICGYSVNKYLNSKLTKIGKEIKKIKNCRSEVQIHFEKEQTFLVIEKLKKIESGPNYVSNEPIKKATEELLLVLREIEAELILVGSFSKIKLGCCGTKDKNKDKLSIYYLDVVSKVEISLDELMLNAKEEFSLKQIITKYRIKLILEKILNLRIKFAEKLSQLKSRVQFDKSLLSDNKLKIVKTANESLNKKTLSSQEANDTLEILDECLENIFPTNQKYPQKSRSVHIYTENKEEVPIEGKESQVIQKEKIIEFDRNKFMELLSVQIERRIQENTNRREEEQEKEAETLEVLKGEVEFNKNLNCYSMIEQDEKDSA